jgi:hypothetical protein
MWNKERWRMKYTFDRYWGVFTVATSVPGKSTIVAYGYSGHQDCLNDIHKQNIQGVGPLPAGTYVISRIYDDVERGKHTCELLPQTTNKMFGRSGFLIHGDTMAEAHNASDGCIVTTYAIRTMFMVQDIIEVV